MTTSIDLNMTSIMYGFEPHLPVESSRSHESRVKCVWSVGCHQHLQGVLVFGIAKYKFHLNVATRVETIQLVNQLQHGSLNLPKTRCKEAL